MGELRIDLLGTSFSITATEDTQHLERLLGYYESIVNDVSKIPAVKNNSLRTSILAGLMLCDELYKTKSTVAELKNNSALSRPQQAAPKVENNNNAEVQERTQRMIEKINKVLD